MADSSKSTARSGGRSRPASEETAKKTAATGNKHGGAAVEKIEGKKKGRPRADNQELRNIPAIMVTQWKEEFKNHSRVKCPSSGCWLEFPSVYGLKYHYQRCQGATISEKLNHQCPYCEAAFASKTRVEKHKAWNHADRVSQEPTAGNEADNEVQKTPVKGSAKKRAAESSDTSPIRSKVKKTREVFQHSQNGEYVPQKAGRKHQQGAASEASPTTPGGSEGEAGSFPEEDPERTRHRRKQRTPKKFTGEQPSISGTFGMKGLTKSEEKVKSGRGKKVVGNDCNKEPKRKAQGANLRKDPVSYSPGSKEERWQQVITEKGEVVCPTCSLISRKTVPGLKKHMEICLKLQDALKCQDCQKQFKSKAGLNYHTMAEHINKPSAHKDSFPDEQEERDRLRKVLKQMGKLKCPNEGCTATFSSLMGYQYHQKRCGKDPSDIEKHIFVCKHCRKNYKSKAGHDYHIRSEHSTSPKQSEQVAAREEEEEEEIEDFERTPSGRVRRRSAQVAVFHLQEIAEDELAKDWNKRKMKDDLVPDIKRLNYTRPGLPKFNPKVLDNWKKEVKEKGFIFCVNNHCEAVYSSVSGLKAHLANCNKGGGSVGKYRCLLCQKEFSSESGVKYHIGKTHSVNWFRTSNPVSPNGKRKELNNVKKDGKNSTTGKKRGRKPKERPPEPLQKDTEKAESKTSSTNATDTTASAANKITGDQRKETKPPAKKRGRAKKVQNKP
ncbi:zinc finger protein 512B-like isoform X1 [Acipenser ruthenus]|uniref:zinc finger protein 512B-like isoform X1 n=2 Tax=Acipenser ruthenus TaxID=7906 RepID=UPI002740D3B0|nr:zinc finger protein 512B-like isoform X1 [Acipenser ruthenus]XP_058846948.1 zinc finger protein 512B-like isoform X1 [Acipenser ruthenus]